MPRGCARRTCPNRRIRSLVSSCTSSHCVTTLSVILNSHAPGHQWSNSPFSLSLSLSLCLSQYRGRTLGPLTNRVESFRIVLADGTAMEVVSPTEYTSQMNDDLFWAVRGGSSGAWGVLTEITFKPYRDEDYFSMYWVDILSWDAEGAANLFRKYSELAHANLHDNRWSVGIIIVGDIWVQDELPGMNSITLEMSWVAPIEQAADYDPTFFESIVEACTGCFSLLSVPNSVEPLSFSLRYKYVSHHVNEHHGLRRLPSSHNRNTLRFRPLGERFLD